VKEKEGKIRKRKDLYSKGVYTQIVPILQIVRDLDYAINLLGIFG